MKIPGFVLFAVLASCQPAENPEILEAKRLVTQSLADPMSVEFQDVEITGPCVQGKINAKNGFGGYVGFRDFFYNTSTHDYGIDPGNSTDAELALGLMQRHNELMSFADASIKCANAATAYIHAHAGG